MSGSGQTGNPSGGRRVHGNGCPRKVAERSHGTGQDGGGKTLAHDNYWIGKRARPEAVIFRAHRKCRHSRYESIFAEFVGRKSKDSVLRQSFEIQTTMRSRNDVDDNETAVAARDDVRRSATPTHMNM